MKSSSAVIPAVLCNSPEVFRQRLEFGIEAANAVHIDLTDGDFFGSAPTLQVEHWPHITAGYSEAHLMVKHPIGYLRELKSKGIIRAIVHVESHFEVEELVAEARQRDILLGFAVNPETDLEDVVPFFTFSNYVQVMGIEPGRTGQPYITQTPLAVAYFKRLHSHRLTVAVDGGINRSNITALHQAGASYFISTSALFARGNWHDNYNRLVKAVENDH